MKLIFNIFSMDKPIVVIVVGLIILVVLAQSFFFLFKGISHAKRVGIDKKVISNTIKGSATFTIVPAISILIAVITLYGSLGGYALPWLRLSVIGAVTYEVPAAEAVKSSLGIASIANASHYITVALVMTLGIALSSVAAPFTIKPISNQLYKMKTRNNEWINILVDSLFIGMISAFLGLVFSDVKTGMPGLVPVFVMLISAATMALMGVIIKVTKLKVLENYAIPISMIVSMVCAIPITRAILG